MNCKKLSPYRPHKLDDNETCPYCGTILGKEFSKDHVIGRKFVPTGSLHRSWNIHVRSCRDCNNPIKSSLENDISAITLQPDAWGSFPSDDESLLGESIRKGSSMSQLTKQRVASSFVHQDIGFSLGQHLRTRFLFSGPPQLQPDRVFELARLQLHGFAYWMSYDQEKKRGKWLPGIYTPLHFSYRGDWGNPLMLSFMNLVASWTGLVAVAADGFFKVAIRQNPASTCWAWAFEWNKNLRVIGLHGDVASLQEIRSCMPSSSFSFQGEGENDEKPCQVRMRSEVPLQNSSDTMFCEP